MMKRNLCQRIVALLLCVLLLASPMTDALRAEAAQPELPAALSTPEGEIPVEEDWDEVYPYGTFAFGTHQADVAEPGATTLDGGQIPGEIEIPVYRLGGTVGRVTATVTYAPAITTDPTGEQKVYDYAASGRDDIRIEYDNPSPIAAYQSPGMPEELLTMQPGDLAVVADVAEDPDAATPMTLRLSGAAEGLRWQVKERGLWQDVRDAEGDTLDAVWGDVWDAETDAWSGTDFRCLYRGEDGTLCSVSLLGEEYEPIAPPPPIPEDLDAQADPGRTVLEIVEEFGVYEFPLTFADGESVKYIRVKALDDALPELPEMGLFTITGCVGGALSDMCSTLTLMVSDNDTGEASEVGFAAEEMTFDRAEGAIRVPVVRTGGKTYNVTVHYETVDGTAVQGVDYARAEGDLAFAGSLDEASIPIELIAGAGSGDKTLTLVLSDLRGGGELCSLGASEITVTLTGESADPASPTGLNLASVLAGGDGEAVAMETAAEALIPEAGTVRADTQAGETATLSADLLPAEPARKSYVVNPHFVFRRADLAPENDSGEAGTNGASETGSGQAVSGNPKYEEKLDAYMKTGYWADWEVALGSMPIDNEGYQLREGKSTQNYRSKLTAWTTRTATNNNGGEILVQDLKDFSYSTESGTEIIPDYTRISANFDSRAELVVGNGTLYSDYIFITRLAEVGQKATNIFESNKWLRPHVSFWSTVRGTEMDTLETKYEVYGVKDRRYFWYSQGGYNDAGTWVSGAAYGGDRGKDVFGGMEYVTEEPLRWGKVAEMDMEFAMRDQWKDESGSWNETCGDNDHTSVDVLTYAFARRTFRTTGGDHGIGLVLYTANDANEPGNYTKIQPGSALPAGEQSLYDTLTPAISIVEGAGGVSDSGELYVGSRLKIDASGISGFDIPNDGVFMTNRAGEKVGTVECKNQVFYITMQWDGMTQSALDDEYQLNILLERSQSLKVDIVPSTPHAADGATADSAYEDTFSSLFRLTDGVEDGGFIARTIDVTCSKLADEATSQTSKLLASYFPDTITYYLSRGAFGTGDQGVYTVTNKLKNIQSVNFNQDPDDVILYNGCRYAGNEDIPLTEADMSSEAPVFTFIDAANLDDVSSMAVLIDHVEVYYDGDGNNAIDGALDAKNRFVLSEGSKDRFVALVDGDYPESYFTAHKDADGTIHQHFFKVFLTLRPRALQAPAGQDQQAQSQLLPAFLSAVTDETAAAALTDEQRAIRYVRGVNTDGHPMYGAEATKITYIDIPLGGDVGEKTMHTVTTAKLDAEGEITGSSTAAEYGWTPEYTGQLLVPYDNPTPITDTNNITGGAVSIAGENPALRADGTYAYSKAGRDNVNASLASFSGRTTFAIGIQPQVKPTEATPATKAATQSGIDSLDDIHPETLSVGTVTSTPGADGVMNQQSGGDAGSTDGKGPGEDIGHDEFSPDLGVELPSLEFELGDYAKIIIDGYQVGFAIGIPIYKYEDTKYSGSQQSSTDSDGTKTSSYKDENGNTITDKEKKDGTKTHSTTTSTPDPKDPNLRTELTQTEITKPDGTKGYYNSTTTYKKDSDGKEHAINRTVDTNQPNTPSDPPEEKKNGFVEAHGQMATLNEFRKALMSPLKGSMKKFTDDFWSQDNDDSLKNAKNGNATSQKVEVSFTVQISMMFEFNPIDNGYYFKNAGLAATLGVEFTVQHRFTPCPLVYVYVKIGLEIEAKVSLSVLRTAKEGKAITGFQQGSLAGLSRGETAIFALDMRKAKENPDAISMEGSKNCRGFHLTLDGKVYMEVFDNARCSGKALTSGALTGDGSVKEVLYKDYNKQVYVRLTPVGAVTASDLRPVVGAASKVVFDGLSITPGISLEAGVGVGIEVAHFELFLRTSIAITMTMGGYLEETEKYEGFYISDFEWSLALGFHLVIAFFNFSMDCIAIGVQGQQHGTGGWFNWDITASAANGAKVLWEKSTYTSADAKSLPDEPKPPTGVNIGQEDNGIRFYNADGTACDFTDELPDDWFFSTGVSANRWSGGDFKGEIPMNADYAYAVRDGASVTFDTDADTFRLYFDGKVSVSSGASVEYKDLKKSPAKISLGDAGGVSRAVTVTVKAGTKLDRYAVGSDPGRKSAGGPITAVYAPQSLVHVSGPKDISATQTVHVPQPARRAVQPTGTQDFQLSGYNTAGDAKKLVSGLAGGYTYKLFQTPEDSYIVYPLMLDGVPQLVMSKVVMTGALATIEGLQNPVDKNAANAYILLDGDGTTDYDFSVEASGSTVTAIWISAGRTEGTYAVKHASMDLSSGTGFDDVQVYSLPGAYSFLPTQAGGTAVWAGRGDGDNGNADLRAFLLAKHPDLTAEALNTCSTDDPALANTVFYWATQSKLNELCGGGSVLTSSSGASAEIPGETVDNLEAGLINGQLCLLYSTSKAAYFDTNSDVPATVDAGHMDADTERGLIRRLYLRTLTDRGFGPAKCLQTVIDFENCSEDTLSSAKLTDGIYVNSALQGEGRADPYFGNLRFITAELFGNEVQTAALYEMGGNTYLLSEADLTAILGGKSSAAVKPIFEVTAGTDVNIGSDGKNMAVVYTAPVADSLSNAIYAAWWDKNVGTWGSPTILATRNLQIFEDRITYGMNAEEAERAYLGLASTPGGHTGSKSRLTFSNLQMATRPVTRKDGTAGQQLMILTEGSLVKLKDQTYQMGDGKEPLKTLIPDGDPDVGFYAIAFGEGEQALGQASLSLANYDFTIGSELIGGVRFTNTGTAAIRSPDDNPATAKLYVDKGEKSETLAEWTIAESIPSGSETVLSFKSSALTGTLPEGARFCLEVSEDASYFKEGAFSETLDNLMTVKACPELSFGEFSLELASIEDGAALLSLRSSVQNTGSESAKGVYIQFCYDTGEKDAAGNAIYAPVDITGSKLVTGVQEEIQKRGSHVSADTIGVYQLSGTDGGALDPGHSRTVTGMLRVPLKCFAEQADLSGAHLRAEIYSDGDLPDLIEEVYTSEHNEYNEANNQAEQTIRHATVFNVPARISMALGNTLRLPVSFASTSTAPEIVLSEISDGSEDWSARLGLAYYDPDRGVIVAAPNANARALLEQKREVTGVLQIRDLSTNSLSAITFRVGESGEGINIYRDDATFRFRNPDGSDTDLYAPSTAGQGWSFPDRGAEIDWIPGDMPMNRDLCLAGLDGASMQFDSVADTMQIVFKGTITVSSPMLDRDLVFTESPAKLEFHNDTGKVHTVTVRAARGTRLDRYTATYKTETVPDADADAPVIAWSRSFPDPASLTPGQAVTATCYVLDSSGLRRVSLNGEDLSESTEPKLTKTDEGFWSFEYTFTQNVPMQLRAYDAAGNTSRCDVNVDWFNDVLSEGAVAGAPSITPAALSFLDGEGRPIDAGTPLTEPPRLRSSYEAAAGERVSAFLLSGRTRTELAAEDERTWRTVTNGFYLVRVDRDDGSWGQAVTALSTLDADEPQLSVTRYGERLEITASDNARLASLTVNGYPLKVSGKRFTGTFLLRCSGVYEVTVTDNSGLSVSTTVTVDLPLGLRNTGVTTDLSCSGGNIIGAITVDPAGVYGGDYLPDQSDPASNLYVNRYFAAVIPESADPASVPADAFVELPHTFSDLQPGAYRIVLRDIAGKQGVDAVPVIVEHPDNAWKEPTYEWSKDLQTVTAARVCSLDPTHFELETVKTEFILLRPSTFERDGQGAYAAKFRNPAFTEQRRFVTVPAINCDGGDACPGRHFLDMPPAGNWAHIPIDWAVVNQVTKGTAADRFSPAATCTRGQVVTFLWRTAGCPEPRNTGTAFTDLKPGAFYEKAVAWAVEQGITKGATDTTFAPDATCTRGQIVTFLYRFRESPAVEKTESPFTDLKPGAYYEDAVAWAVANGVTNGMSPTSFAPDATCRRDQVVTFLYRSVE